MLTPKLAEQLPKFDARGILFMDDGNTERRLNGLINDAMDNISRYPFTGNGKVEKRKITVEIEIVPELKEISVPIETNGGRVNHVKSHELAGAIVQVKLAAGMPVAKSNVVRLACQLKNQKIVAAHFNPHNNDAPEQLELDLDDEDDDEK
jgi:hypothetical protein